jgi:hypothetical protein
MARWLRQMLRTAAVAACIPLIACTIDVREDSGDKKAEVDIRTPVGDVSVRSTGEAADTGLPAYPGATLLREGDEPESANVNVGAFGVGVRVAAAKFESGDGEAAILDFYRQAMAPYGAVMECRGEVDFRDSGPVCRQRGNRDLQLVTGTRNNQRIVAVKPRGSGSEIALVHVQVRGVS